MQIGRWREKGKRQAKNQVCICTFDFGQMRVLTDSSWQARVEIPLLADHKSAVFFSEKKILYS